VNFQGKEGAEGTESTGEASSIGERTHGEKANCRHAEAHADTGPSAGPSTCNSHALVGILSFCRQILSLLSPCKSTVLLSSFLFGFLFPFSVASTCRSLQLQTEVNANFVLVAPNLMALQS
jgi:hypothetical protein